MFIFLHVLPLEQVVPCLITSSFRNCECLKLCKEYRIYPDVVCFPVYESGNFPIHAFRKVTFWPPTPSAGGLATSAFSTSRFQQPLHSASRRYRSWGKLRAKHFPDSQIELGGRAQQQLSVHACHLFLLED